MSEEKRERAIERRRRDGCGKAEAEESWTNRQMKLTESYIWKADLGAS